ncbi:MAG: hypothetical protein ABFC84_10465 [Veillonellales bacterium]
MLTTIILTIVLVFFAGFFIVYKRKLLLRVLSINMTAPTTQLQQQLEQTGDAVIEQMENKIAHLEYLLEAADEKIAKLEKQIIEVKEMTQTHSVTAGLPQIPIPHQIVKAYTGQEYGAIWNHSISDSKFENSEKNPESETQGSMKQNVSDDKQRLILAMADQGYNVTEISKATGTGKGAIMLLLQLNKK